MEAMKLTAHGAPVLGVVMLAMLFVTAVWDVMFSGARLRAWTEPLGVLVGGAAPLWLPGLVPWNIVVGAPLIAIVWYTSRGYRSGSLPRHTRSAGR
ncbi:hypothetical protein SAMN05216267_10953 [Actinacidiphila rubida]|uniref:Uncharacterized protein n=2 Tax=Actinacidiphila rubida TaxID=310780 RepID=A0A1H8UZP1_9ACTN|nr:hypothetical protein [Actinacidiphila rubida]SEP08447.1 hypothetical protein SAMN05216267_10953 [Actinacidiphila rubida]